ncbi:protein phosphatase inhibitor 2 [Nephila pilipes]|uniref:Protein phosphatase inhibitor 2 n=1 Tax=Nephila pilipes TaxID=299642 RepID=A0A8X6PMN1_NEPPI|nr:protein phosphatase inhibitor 2 [Nephila pilipes]
MHYHFELESVIMTENLSKKPAKGILKTSSSQEQAESNKSSNADIKWDEMNILQTLHPPDKDYGHMKIDEPKTPYSYYEEKSGQEISGHGSDTLDADLLAKKINLCSEKDVKPAVLDSPNEEEIDEVVTEEERAQRSAFEYKRKMHYNEFYAVKLARKLIDKEDDDEDEAEDEETKEDK